MPIYVLFKSPAHTSYRYTRPRYWVGLAQVGEKRGSVRELDFINYIEVSREPRGNSQRLEQLLIQRSQVGELKKQSSKRFNRKTLKIKILDLNKYNKIRQEIGLSPIVENDENS